MMAWKIALALILLPSAIKAQTQDTTSAWRYYPLEIGNVWEYQNHGMAGSGDRRVWISADTVLHGTRYFVQSWESIAGDRSGRRYEELVRFDSTTAQVLFIGADGNEHPEYPGCPLNANFGETVECRTWTMSVSGGHGRSFSLLDGTVLEDVTIKEYDGKYSYIAGIGFVDDKLILEPGGTTLVYARIQGVEYGRSISVATEDRPRASADFDLSVYPSPLQTEGTVRVELAHAQWLQVTLYDALGRQVDVLQNGRLPSGIHLIDVDARGLPGGLYILHARGADVTASELLLHTR